MDERTSTLRQVVTITLTIVLFFVVYFVVGDFLGCGKATIKENPARMAIARDLKELGQAYMKFQDSEKRPPKSFEELNAKYSLSAGCANATVIWGGWMREMCKEDARWEDVVIAHSLSPSETYSVGAPRRWDGERNVEPRVCNAEEGKANYSVMRGGYEYSRRGTHSRVRSCCRLREEDREETFAGRRTGRA